MPSNNTFERFNDEVHIRKDGWQHVGLTTYRDDYYNELTSSTWNFTNPNSETDDKGYLKSSSLGLLHRYIMGKWYGEDVLQEMTEHGYVVDHMNNIHHDCRISNLEFLKKAYNTARIVITEEEANQPIVFKNGAGYINRGAGSIWINSVHYDKGWTPSSEHSD